MTLTGSPFHRRFAAPALAICLSVVAPFVALSVLGALIFAAREIALNGYLALGWRHVALQYLARRVTREFVFGLLSGLALLAMVVAVFRPKRMAAALPYLLVLEGFLLFSRIRFARNWSVTALVGGVPLPGFLWMRDTIGRLLVETVVCMIVVALVLRHSRLRAWTTRPLVSPAVGWVLLAVSSGLVAAVNLGTLAVHSPRASHPVNIIWITWDSTRADHISYYGYPRPTTPHLDALAAESVVFRRAIAQHNWTRPSYQSMFAGLHSWEFPGGRFDLSVTTLAEILNSYGYRTVGFVENPNLDAEFNLNQGFDRYFQLPGSSPPRVVNRCAFPVLEDLAGDAKPFFAFIHYQQPHYPYHDDNPFARQFVRSPKPLLSEKQTSDLMVSHGVNWKPRSHDADAILTFLTDSYDASLRLADEGLGELLAFLRAKGLFDNSLIIFNSDHGEEFDDRGGFGHAHGNVYAELTFVPMVIHFPASLTIPHQDILMPVQNLDIRPTILKVAGIPRLDSGRGSSLLPLTQLRDRIIFSSGVGTLAVRTKDAALFAGTQGRRPVQIIRNSNADFRERDLQPYTGADSSQERLKAAADLWVARITTRKTGSANAEVTPDMMRRLKSLGYLQ